MPILSVQIDLVASTPTAVLTTDLGFTNVVGNIQDQIPFTLKNEDATHTIYVGGPNVSASNGQTLLPGQVLPWSLYGQFEIPYVFTTGTGVIVSVLAGRQ